jgi:hypothetical protein
MLLLIILDLASVKTNCFYLEGSTYFGDNINDEWFIVFLLFELTKLHQELVISLVSSIFTGSVNKNLLPIECLIPMVNSF